MEIKRTTEVSIETTRQFVVRQAGIRLTFRCPQCGEPTLAAERVADVFGISRRRVYQLVEASAAHFAEIETGAVMVCLPSLAAILEQQTKRLKETEISPE